MWRIPTNKNNCMLLYMAFSFAAFACIAECLFFVLFRFEAADAFLGNGYKLQIA